MRNISNRSHLGESARHPRNHLGAAIWLLTLLVLASLTARPAGQRPLPNPIDQQSRSPFEGVGANDPSMAARQMRALNADRQKSLISDGDKLLKLAKELNTEVENSNPQELTQVELRKVADIERLARNVRQKMSLSFAGGPAFEEPVRQQQH